MPGAHRGVIAGGVENTPHVEKRVDRPGVPAEDLDRSLDRVVPGAGYRKVMAGGIFSRENVVVAG